MSEGILDRLDRISAAVLPGKTHTLDLGENYYSFEVTDELGTRCLLAHLWIDPDTSDREIGEKLSRNLHESLHPEGGPDDASVPHIQTEGSNHR